MPKDLLDLAKFFDESFEIAKNPENFHAQSLLKKGDDYILSIINVKEGGSLNLRVPEYKKQQHYSSWKDFFDKADSEFEEKHKKRLEKKSRTIIRTLKSSLIFGIVTGSLSYLFLNTDFTESLENKEFDRKAKFIIPDNPRDVENYEINGVNVSSMTHRGRLAIVVDSKMTLKSQFYLTKSTSDGDARLVSLVKIRNSYSEVEQVKDPEKYQEIFQSLIEKIYEKKKEREKQKEEQVRKIVRNLTDKL